MIVFVRISYSSSLEEFHGKIYNPEAISALESENKD
jgi:hypothetical protein